MSALVNSRDASANVATRARIVLWRGDRLGKQRVAELAGVSRPTVDLWLRRYARDGVGGLVGRPRGAAREQVPASVRARIVALTRATPPAETGLSHWSSREMARYVSQTGGVSVSWHYVANVWRAEGLRPHRQGTFKLSSDPDFAARVADIVGLCLDPPSAAVVPCVDEKTQAQAQALDRH
ncbi:MULTISPECIES: helix-turn-helix domain-containing protein [unclassified Frankia]|uniref:helix-turn-helix domain-containing protein n=1 Tax=unclassified Frankia TaxID=2632575 RepID=UPI001932B793|nr:MULTISPECIES: helix-turn-helix domain-containing protein [unclassified Frankia]MBL7625222.1 helix-turn-helix domain-containing protein [Frankia sp. AgB1.8]